MPTTTVLRLSHRNGRADLKRAIYINKEVYNFLATARLNTEMGSGRPGRVSFIILENYALPGGFMIGTDSTLVVWEWSLAV